MTSTHEQRAVNMTLDWVTWAEEDTDFWVWFWQWYRNFDAVWTFDHEAGEVLNDTNYEWEWFQNHTAQEGEVPLLLDKDDSDQWNWKTWDEYWHQEDAIDHSTKGYMSRRRDQAEELKEADEDDICGDGTYMNEVDTCLPCQMGCAHCQSMGHCFDCFDNF